MKDINLHVYDKLSLICEDLFCIVYLQELVRFSGRDLLDDYYKEMPEISQEYLIELQTKQILDLKDFLSGLR